MAKSFWQRGEDYAKKVSGEIIEQIKAGEIIEQMRELRRGRSRGSRENRSAPKTSQPARSTAAATAST